MSKSRVFAKSESDNDIFYKKTVSYRHCDHNLNFHVSQTLFSSHDIDIGTRRLLSTLVLEDYTYSKILDLGCGYGPIGIALKSVNPESTVQMVDKDSLALDYTRKNLELNHLKASVYASLGFDQVSDADFDLIVSNIPAKAGEPVLSYILSETRLHLRPNGRVAIVVINAIADYVMGIISVLGVNVLVQKKYPGHMVFVYEFPESSSVTKPRNNSFERGIYDREEKVFSVDHRDISIRTAYGLPEFDTLSYETQIVIDTLRIMKGKQMNKVIVFNPAQGILPITLTQFMTVKEIALIDRDLLALEVSKRNIILNGFEKDHISMHHQADLKISDVSNVDGIIGVLDEKDGHTVHTMFFKQATQQLSPEGIIVLASGSTPITRIEAIARADKSLGKLGRKKMKGKSVIVLKKK